MQQVNNFAQQNISLPKKSMISSVFDPSIKKNLIFIQNKSQGYQIFHDITKNLRVQVYVVETYQQALQDTLDIYDWRFETQMPIIKTFYVQVCKKSQQFVTLNVFNEHLKMKLGKLYEIPFNQVLYLLKQSAIGFQRLYTKFGGFQVTPQMIAINQKNLCRVWYNQNPDSNLMKPLDLSQQIFINNLLKIFEDRTLKTNQGKIFFKSVYGQVTTFLDLLKYIQQFVRHYKTKVPLKFTLNCSSQLRGTLRRNSLKYDWQKQRQRSTFSNYIQNSLNTSYNKHLLISSLQMDKLSKIKVSQIHFNEKQILNNIKSYSQLNQQKSSNKVPMVTSIMNPNQNGMKGSNHTTIACTHFDPTKLSTSNNFSIHDFGEDSRKNNFLPEKKNSTQSNMKISSQIQLSSSEIKYGRKYSIQKSSDMQTFDHNFPNQKSYQILNYPLKAAQTDQYQLPQTQVHQTTIEEQQKQYISNSNSNSQTNSQEKLEPVINVLSEKQSQKKIRKLSNIPQSESSDDLELSKYKADQIFEKNGWINQLGGILTSQTPMKKSVQIGKQVNLLSEQHQFLYLKTPDLKVYQSFIPNVQGEGNNYFFQ